MSEDVERLRTISHKVIQTELIVCTICISFVFMATVFVIISLVRNKSYKEMPVKMRITLGLYLLICLIAIYSTITLLVHKSWHEALNRTESRIPIAFSVTIWQAIHWQFTNYYLHTACLLRRTF